jgi:DNA recombination protein RmuC
MGLLRVVMYGWQQQKIADEAKTVATLGSDLYRRVSIFGDHITKLGRSLGTAVERYNDAVGSLDQGILPVLRKFKDLQVPTGGKELPDAAALDSTPRLVSAPELQPDFVDNVKTLERKS